MTLEKARLVEIEWDSKQVSAKKAPNAKIVEAQFNPQTLKLSFANQNKGGDQPGGSSAQFVGSGTSKMSVELLFDITDSGSTVNKAKGVREKTEDVAYFLQPKKRPDQKNKRVPPGISFEWGSFIFRGIVDSLEETLDYFSEEGIPLRATLSLSISRQTIEFVPLAEKAGPQSGAGAGAGSTSGTPGTQPLTAARPNESLQSMAGRAGKSGDWKAIAAANSIDDPLRLKAGALINMSANVGGSVNGGAKAGGGFNGSVGR